MEIMSMYVDILSSALDGWDSELNGSALIDYAVACRAEMVTFGFPRDGSAYAVLATEVTYDRALIRLCTDHGIEVVRSGFLHRQEERTRLEHELAGAGVDLAEPRPQASRPQE
jgi:hypothetical protein